MDFMVFSSSSQKYDIFTQREHLSLKFSSGRLKGCNKFKKNKSEVFLLEAISCDFFFKPPFLLFTSQWLWKCENWQEHCSYVIRAIHWSGKAGLDTAKL